jgi:hypothetical protein
MALLDKIAKAASVGGQAALRGSGTKTALGVLTAGAVVKGLSDSVGQSAINNAMDIAFDNPEADRAVLGTDLTPSMLLGEAGLGPISGIARSRNTLQYGVNTGPMPAVAGTIGGGALGAMAGAKFGGILGFAAGGIAGAAIGGGIGAAPTVGYINRNRQLLRESPYSNTSMMTADALNATGDIVFGMHNSRRGY